MVGRRSTPGVVVRTLAVGLDLGSPVVEVARRGFHSTFSNQMRHLGGWVAGPVLHLAHDVVGEIARREGVGDDVVVALTAPGWLGWCDRHHVAALVDPGGSDRIVWLSTTTAAVAAVVGRVDAALALPDLPMPEVMAAIDLDLGISAALVAVDPAGVRELASVAVPPKLGLDGIRPADVAWVVEQLAAAGRRVGVDAVHRLVLVTSRTDSRPLDDRAGTSRDATIAAIIDQAIRSVDQSWGECPVETVRSRADVARAAVGLVDADGLDLVGVTPRAVGVLLDDTDTGRSSVHVVLPRDEQTPVAAKASFDVGPDDGATVHLDLYEELADDGAGHATDHHAADRHAHRLVLTARLDARRPGVEQVDVTFRVGSDGQLRIEPASDAALETWSLSWAVSRTVMVGEQLALAGGEPSAATVPPPPPVRASSTSVTFPTSTGGRRALSAPLELSDAVGRAERLVSRAVGRVVAIRSVPALAGCSDQDDPLIVGERLERLARVLDQRAEHDGVTLALVDAVDVARRALDAAHGRLYVGGTARDIAHELGRVVEHLAVVIGAVTPAERNRLVADAHLLGLDHDRARRLVDELIDDAGIGCDGVPEPLEDPMATVVVSASTIELIRDQVVLDHDQAAIRVVVLEA